jgi:hypothetical protein
VNRVNLSDSLSRVSATRTKGGVVVEKLFTGLLVTMFLVIGWFAAYVVYKLYHGQR